MKVVWCIVWGLIGLVVAGPFGLFLGAILGAILG